MSDSEKPVTHILRRVNAGDADAVQALLDAIYDQLHQMAKREMRAQAPNHSLDATGLVNEVYLKLFQGPLPEWKDRRHFLALSSRAMRSILVDHARAKNAHKRKPTGDRVVLDELTASIEERAIDLLALDEGLEKLAELDPDLVRVVELRFFGGLTMLEVSKTLGVSLRTVERDWGAARAWLRREIG